jgi:hypothetical protein
VGYGLHYPDLPDAGVEVRLLAWQQILRPTDAFTHLSSAELRGWWLPPLPADLPVWLMQICSRRPPMRPGLQVIRRRYLPESEVVRGVRVTTPAETLVTCARDVGVLDLVVMADSALRAGDVTLRELTKVAAELRRGAPKLRQAIPLLDARSESPWESLLRTLHLVCGVDVEPQHEIRHRGSFVARADLWLTGTTAIHEYDGAVHLSRDAQRDDLRRLRRLLDAGVDRRGYTSDDLLHRPVGVLRDADAALGRPHDPGRIGAWHALLADSLFTPAGTVRFRQRLAPRKTVNKVTGNAA